MKNYTTIEQSKKLLELGLKSESADMWWNFYSVTTDDTTPQIIRIDNPWIGSFNWNNELDNLPCWSTGALLELLRTRKYCNFLTLHSSRSLKWILNTSYYELANCKEKETIGETQIEAVYNMVVWLLENGLF